VLANQGLTLRSKRRVKTPLGRGTIVVRRRVRIVEKDPQLVCGKGTTVVRLFRVKERLEEDRVTHLVFNDRHGWYCEHGPQCIAVADVKKHLR
jgi:hypothetical protein